MIAQYIDSMSLKTREKIRQQQEQEVVVLAVLLLVTIMMMMMIPLLAAGALFLSSPALPMNTEEGEGRNRQPMPSIAA